MKTNSAVAKIISLVFLITSICYCQTVAVPAPESTQTAEVAQQVTALIATPPPDSNISQAKPEDRTSADIIAVINRVDAYYTSAFNTLITLTLAVLGFAGVLLPILLQVYQSRSMARDRKGFEEFAHQLIKVDAQQIKESILGQVKSVVSDEMETLKKQISGIDAKHTRTESLIHARYWHLCGISNMGNGSTIPLAAVDFCRCLKHYIEADKSAFVVTAVDNVVRSLNGLDYEQLESTADLKDDYETACSALEGYNKDRRYAVELAELRRAFENCSKRKSSKK